eukprot:3914183-Rhodomonas_salina.1
MRSTKKACRDSNRDRDRDRDSDTRHGHRDTKLRLGNLDSAEKIAAEALPLDLEQLVEHGVHEHARLPLLVAPYTRVSTRRALCYDARQYQAHA